MRATGPHCSGLAIHPDARGGEKNGRASWGGLVFCGNLWEGILTTPARQGLPREAARRMKSARVPASAPVESRDPPGARCGPALAGMKRRAIPAGSRAKVGAGRRGDSAEL